ncbi:hypothetical protein BCR44DRAFT_29268 [Catenaria anguillulae PL171]|uniref:Uncharacterized protein n=1 Tax=Catenaria anguillulae PL171 TaxID=765915 RepID=A0A1Y2HU96_9FUNG|nr:hypothetical protein BCR44DRAFT_29268 [Catenaria anguillulae PL171]
MSSYDSPRQGASYNNDGYRGRGGGNYHQGGRGGRGGGSGYRGGYNNNSHNSPRTDGSSDNRNDGFRGRGRGGGRGGGYRGGGDRGGGYRGGSNRGGSYHNNNNNNRPQQDDNSPHAAFFRDGDFAGAEPSREPEHWYQPYPAIPPHEWTPRYATMNAKTLNLRTDRVPLVIPELRVADDEWGDPRLDVPDKVPAIPLVGWLPVCQRNPGAKWSESQVVSVVTRPIVRQDLVDDELTWPACIDPEILQRSGMGGDEEAGDPTHQSWLHQDSVLQQQQQHMYPDEPMHQDDDHQHMDSDPSMSSATSSSMSSSRPHTSGSDNTMINSAGIPVGSLTAAATASALVPEGMVQPYTVTRENAKKRMIEVSWQDQSDRSSAAQSPGAGEASGQPPSKKQRTRG